MDHTPPSRTRERLGRFAPYVIPKLSRLRQFIPNLRADARIERAMKKSHEEIAKELTVGRGIIPSSDISTWILVHAVLALNETLKELLKEARRK